MSDEGAGFGAASGQDAAQVDFLAAGRRAIDICRRNKGLRNIEPGEYEVILSADAVADMLGTMGYMAFNGLAVTEGRSMLSGHIGEKLFGENIDIWDDGLTPAGFPLPFDFEGSPRQKLHLVDHGVVKDIPFDRTTAARAGTSTTGHALPPPNSFGPIPLHLAMNGGPATMEEMIRSTKKGLLVTRFHYINIVHPGKGIWTGMTRDGTFYIEDGQVKYPVRNLRFTQSMGQALNHVDMLGRTVLVGGELGSIVAPPAKIAGWNFTGATEH
jgi:predicted Zn-dependent protease